MSPAKKPPKNGGQDRKPTTMHGFGELGERLGLPPVKAPAPPLDRPASRDRREAGDRGGASSGEPSEFRVPLPRRVAAEVRQRWRDGHPGLVYDKFAHGWSDKWKLDPVDRKNPKKDFLTHFVDAYAKNAVARDLYRQARARRAGLVADLARQGWHVERTAGAAAWRFVSGLGIAHPFETGFVFDRLHGVPFLPGSSVKGAARAWAEQACEDAGTAWYGKKAAVEAVFGPELNDEGDTSRREPARGAVVFFDAYPTAAPRGKQDAGGWPALEVDLLNPHYKEYYESKGKTPPADYLSPVPIFFLTVAPRQWFEFVVAVRSETGDEWQATLARAGVDSAEKLAQLALAAVRGAASEAGLGGKTAVGYGYFDEVRR